MSETVKNSLRSFHPDIDNYSPERLAKLEHALTEVRRVQAENARRRAEEEQRLEAIRAETLRRRKERLHKPWPFWLRLLRRLHGRRQDDTTERAHVALAEIELEGEFPMLGQLKPELLRLLSDKKQVTAALVKEKRDPRDLIYALIAKAALHRLASGHHHIYRGVLDMEGRELRQAFTIAAGRLVSDSYDDATYREDLANMQTMIAEAG